MLGLIVGSSGAMLACANDDTAGPPASTESSMAALAQLEGEAEDAKIPTKYCPRPTPRCDKIPDVDPYRSLAISDIEILRNFTFENVMERIVKTSGDRSISTYELYERWWDTQNDASRALHPDQSRCDDTMTDGVATFNGYGFDCPRAEGTLVDTDPYAETIIDDTGAVVPNPDGYIPIALTNRFDLAPADGSHCGEYRIVFAKRSGQTNGLDRNLLIFEAALPNPYPECGVNACLPVVKFWTNLSRINNPHARRLLLEGFYFIGLPGYGPVLHADNFGPKGGQIRTNQFMAAAGLAELGQFQNWQLREFQLTRTCDEPSKWWHKPSCKLGIKQVTVKTNPFGGLFATSDIPHYRAFQGLDPAATPGDTDDFLDDIPRLALADPNLFFSAIDDKYNAGQSTEPLSCVPGGPFPLPADACYVGHAGDVPTEFLDAIQGRLTELDIPLTPAQIINRADVLSCAGCHHNVQNADLGQGITWPDKGGEDFGFVHINEIAPENGKFRLSKPMHELFLPHRKNVLERFLCEGGDMVQGGYSTGSTDFRLTTSSPETWRTLGGSRVVH